MKCRLPIFPGHPSSTQAFTLIEILIAAGVGSMLLAVVAILSLYGARAFAALGNYADLDNQARAAVDGMSREMRQASLLVSFSTNASSKSLTFTNANEGSTIIYTWDASLGTITCAKTGQPLQTNLTGCTAWSFALYQRTPLVTPTNILYYPATNINGVLTNTLCKLIDMSWTCTRTNFALMSNRRLNTESIQTAQIVLRNKK